MRSPTPPGARLRAAADEARRKAPRPVIRIVTRTAEGLAGIELFDRAMTLAAQAFTSLFPLIITVAALFPDSSGGMAGRFSDMLGLPEDSRAVIAQVFPSDPASGSAFGIVGILIVLVSATSFSRALARMYAKVWQVTLPRGRAVVWRWFAALFGVTLTTVTLKTFQVATSGLFAELSEPLLVLVVGAAVWTWAPWLLLARQVPWRLLLPGGALMGLCTVGTAIASAIYLPRAFVSASQQFGALGIAFTSIGWLFVVSFALVCSTVLGAVLARDESQLAGMVVGRRNDPTPPLASVQSTPTTPAAVPTGGGSDQLADQ